MNEEVILEIKPKFINALRYIINLPAAFSLSLGIVVIFYLSVAVIGILGNEGAYSIIDSALLTCICCLVVCVLATILCLPIVAYFDKKNFEVTSYKLYPDRIEFEEGFINHKFVTIKMEDIKEIHLDQDFFHRLYNLGCIRFVTAANDSMSTTGLLFRDIENSLAVYTKVKQVHENK